MQRKKIKLDIMSILEEEGLTVEDASKIMKVPKHKILELERNSNEIIIGLYLLCQQCGRDYREFFYKYNEGEYGL